MLDEGGSHQSSSPGDAPTLSILGGSHSVAPQTGCDDWCRDLEASMQTGQAPSGGEQIYVGALVPL